LNAELAIALLRADLFLPRDASESREALTIPTVNDGAGTPHVPLKSCDTPARLPSCMEGSTARHRQSAA